MIDREALLRDHAAGISMAEIAERHGLGGAEEARAAVELELKRLDGRIADRLDDLATREGEADSV